MTEWPDLQSQLQALHNAGAQRLDPLRFRYLKTMLQRLPLAPQATQPLLLERLSRSIQAYQAHWQEQGAKAARKAPLPVSAPGCEPLRGLNRYIHQVTQSNSPQGPQAWPEMKNLAGFREVWANIAVDDQLDRAMVRQPDNAGPLNSHRLVLRTLSLMRQASPDYLRRLMNQIDTLLWLEQVQAADTESKPKTPRRGRSPKSTVR